MSLDKRICAQPDRLYVTRCSRCCYFVTKVTLATVLNFPLIWVFHEHCQSSADIISWMWYSEVFSSVMQFHEFQTFVSHNCSGPLKGPGCYTLTFNSPFNCHHWLTISPLFWSPCCPEKTVHLMHGSQQWNLTRHFHYCDSWTSMKSHKRSSKSTAGPISNLTNTSDTSNKLHY